MEKTQIDKQLALLLNRIKPENGVEYRILKCRSSGSRIRFPRQAFPELLFEHSPHFVHPEIVPLTGRRRHVGLVPLISCTDVFRQ